MALLTLPFLLAAAATDGLPASPPQPVKAAVSAQALVRILPGAKVALGPDAIKQGYTLNAATVRFEDGSRRPARLVEFE